VPVVDIQIGKKEDLSTKIMKEKLKKGAADLDYAEQKQR
jgi:hypothetical protein